MQLALFWPLCSRQALDCLDNNMLLIFQPVIPYIYTEHNHAFCSHPSKLLGLDPMPQWLVLNLSKCWGKTKPAAVRNMKHQKDEVTSKLCYIRYFHFYNFVPEEKLNRSKCMTWKFTNNLIGQSRAACVRPTCEVWLNPNPHRNDDRACKSWKNLQIEPIISGVLSLTTAMHPGSNRDPVQVAHNWIKLDHLANVVEQTVHMFPTDNMTEEVRARSC